MKKAFVGLSGGVDSAVSTALLKNRGYDVTGVFIKAWTPPGYPCPWKEDRQSAMRAAAILNIPFVTLDLEREYKESVADYMIEEYKKGRTPNPDVVCNKEIKFGAFLKWALERGADFVATGHYARTSKGPLWPKGSGQGGPLEVLLMEGLDKNKDQSYFLWTLTQKQLRHILFPIGHLQKEEVRKLARKFGLPQATRKDSQGLCFLGQVDMKEFLSQSIESRKGDVLNTKREIVGYHNGAAFFTIGERHGFTITRKTPSDKPLYVISKDMAKNTITVSPKIIIQQKSAIEGEPSLLPEVWLNNINWILDKLPVGNLECRLRYRQTKIPCKVTEEKGEIKIELKENIYISPGQSLVLYDGEKCLGGGIMR